MTCRYMQFYGYHGILAGIIVAVKQVMPEHEAKLFGVVRLSFKVSPHTLGTCRGAHAPLSWTAADPCRQCMPCYGRRHAC